MKNKKILVLFTLLHLICCISRFNDQWRFSLQRLAFLSAYLQYLQTESLVTREQTAALIGGMVKILHYGNVSVQK